MPHEDSSTPTSDSGTSDDLSPVVATSDSGLPRKAPGRFRAVLVVVAALVLVGVVVSVVLTSGGTTSKPTAHTPTSTKVVVPQVARLESAITKRLVADGLPPPFAVVCPATPVKVGAEIPCKVTKDGQTATVWAIIDASGYTTVAFRVGGGLWVVSAMEPEAASQMAGQVSTPKGPKPTVGPCTHTGAFIDTRPDAEIMRCDLTLNGKTQKNGVAIETVSGVYSASGFFAVVASQGDAMAITRTDTAHIKAAAPADGNPTAPLSSAPAAVNQLVTIALKYSTSRVNGFGIPLAWSAAQPNWPATIGSQPAGAGIGYDEIQVATPVKGASNYAFAFSVRDNSGQCWGAVLEGSPQPNVVVMKPVALTTCSPDAAFAKSGLVAYDPTAQAGTTHNTSPPVTTTPPPTTTPPTTVPQNTGPPVTTPTNNPTG